LILNHLSHRETELLRNELTKIKKQIESSEGIIGEPGISLFNIVVVELIDVIL
jgi:hypothetical protein